MNKNIILLMGGVLLTTIGGCGKAVEDNFGVNNPIQYSQIYSTKSINGANTCNLIIPEDTTFDIYANQGGLITPEEDLIITFEEDSTLLDYYNVNNNTDYQILPPDCYGITHNQVTIKKGSTCSDAMNVSIKTKNLPGTGPFLLPIYLKSVSNNNISINENLRKIYIIVKGTYTSNPFNTYDRTGWTIVDYSSFTNTSGEKDYPEYVLDGNNNTFWSSSYTPVRLTPPHYIVIDMQQKNIIRGLKLRSRVDNGDVMRTNSEPKSVTVYISNDNITWTDAGTYNLPYEKETELFLKYHYSARYLKVQVNTCYNGPYDEYYQAAIGEINIF